MISRNLQCHCSPKLRFSSFHSLSAHFPSFLVSRRKSRREIWSCCLGDRSFIAGAVGRLVGIGRLTLLATARAPTGGPRWSGAGGQVVLCCCSALLLCCSAAAPPPSPAAGGRLREFWWHNGNGATLQCRSKRAHAEAGGDWGTCEQPEQDQQLPPQCMLPDQKCVFETQQENYLSLNGDRFSCYLD